jgi:uncharacterized protein YecE (DUF72 family)
MECAEQLGSKYVYFNNDWEGFAIRDATTLRELLAIPRWHAPSGSSYSTQ